MPNDKRIAIERIWYIFLFVLLFASLVLFIVHDSISTVWAVYSRIYFGLLLLYTWFIFILLFIGEIKKDRAVDADPPPDTKVGVIVPVYNEGPELLIKAIKSVVETNGNKIIYIVDDGSTSTACKRVLRHIAENTDIQVHFFETNKGKRHALYHGVKVLVDQVDFIITIDSDTVLDQNALRYIIRPFSDPKVGATSGEVRLINEKENLLTRMVGAYYWIGLHIYKRAQSSLGIVVCCSGCLSAYRASVIRDIIDDFVNQKFFGEACTHSEDRHLTNLVLKRGYHVKFIPEAISYTETPSTLKGFLKQQQRWKRGYVRESIYTLTYAWKTRPVLFCEILLWELTIPYLSFGLMIGLFVSIFADPKLFLTEILPAWIIFMVVRYIHIFFYAKKKIPGLLIYMLFYDLFLYWQSIYALFTVKNKSWMTR